MSTNIPNPRVLFQQESDPLDHRRDVTKLKHVSASQSFKGVSRGDVKKALIRNTEMTVHPSVYRTDAPKEVEKVCVSVRKAEGNELYKTNLSAPNLNSALRIVKEMKETAQTKPPSVDSAKLLDEEKVLNKVNFPYEEHLYHDLVALSVSDDVVCEGAAQRIKKYRSREKDKEPQLSQFYTPCFSSEPIISMHPAPRTLDPLIDSNIFTVYHRLSVWDTLD